MRKNPAFQDSAREIVLLEQRIKAGAGKRGKRAGPAHVALRALKNRGKVTLLLPAPQLFAELRIGRQGPSSGGRFRDAGAFIRELAAWMRMQVERCWGKMIRSPPEERTALSMTAHISRTFPGQE